MRDRDEEMDDETVLVLIAAAIEANNRQIYQDLIDLGVLVEEDADPEAAVGDSAAFPSGFGQIIQAPVPTVEGRQTPMAPDDLTGRTPGSPDSPDPAAGEPAPTDEIADPSTQPRGKRDQQRVNCRDQSRRG